MMMPQRPPEPEINWMVSLERANLILSILAKQPFEVIAEVMGDLRNQAQQQIQTFQQQNGIGNGMLPGERPLEPEKRPS